MSLKRKTFLGLRSGSAPSRSGDLGRSRKSGWDVSAPPLFVASCGAQGSPFFTAYSRSPGGSLPSRIDPCGKARRSAGSLRAVRPCFP